MKIIIGGTGDSPGYYLPGTESSVCKMLQLACRKAENWHVVYKALQEGQVAIVLMNHNSIFTNSQHFIVL